MNSYFIWPRGSGADDVFVPTVALMGGSRKFCERGSNFDVFFN